MSPSAGRRVRCAGQCRDGVAHAPHRVEVALHIVGAERLDKQHRTYVTTASSSAAADSAGAAPDTALGVIRRLSATPRPLHSAAPPDDRQDRTRAKAPAEQVVHRPAGGPVRARQSNSCSSIFWPIAFSMSLISTVRSPTGIVANCDRNSLIMARCSGSKANVYVVLIVSKISRSVGFSLVSSGFTAVPSSCPNRESASSHPRPRPLGAPACSDPSPGGPA